MYLELKKELVKRFILSHKICLLCVVVGFFLGPAFLIGGLIAGFFADLIVEKISDEKKMRELMGKDKFNFPASEPFDGSMIVCALGVYAMGYAQSAGRLAEAIFGKMYKCDWESLCRLAKETEALNGDLLTESLASKILHEKIEHFYFSSGCGIQLGRRKQRRKTFRVLGFPFELQHKERRA